jgi:hypothetical protein
LAVGGCLNSGCAALNPRPPTEESADKLADQAIIPAAEGYQSEEKYWQDCKRLREFFSR